MSGGDEELPLIGQLRQAVINSGKSLNALARDAGIDPGQLSRFMRGERQLWLPAVAKLCNALGLVLASIPKPPDKQQKKGKIP